MSDAARLAELTLQLCRIPSVIGDEGAICDHVEARLRALGLEVQRLGNTVAGRGPSRGRPRLGLFGHLDTVPGTQEPRIEGDRIYGLGSSDMKGGLAVMLALAEDLDLEAIPFDLDFVFYDKEEGPFVQNGLGPALREWGWLKELALGFCLEPSDNAVQVGAVGTLHATLRFTGKAAHSARPWQGENAVHKAGPLLTELLGRPPVEVMAGGFPFREVMSVTLASGGKARNVIPDRFELNVNYRFAPGKSLEQAQAELRDFVAGRAEVEFTDLSPSGRVVTDNPHLVRFLAITGAKLEPKQAWTDVAQLGAAGIDAVNFGPGISAQAHQAGEYASAQGLLRGYGMFRSFLTAPPAVSGSKVPA